MSDELPELLRKLRVCDSDLGDGDVVKLLRLSCDHWLDRGQHVEMKGVDGAPDWTSLEGNIWRLGESLRQCLVKRKAWRSWSGLFEEITRISLDKRYGKGRESFVLLLGEFSGFSPRDLLIQLLDDPQVVSHAINALRQAKIGNAVEAVRAVLEREKRGRTRSAAKKYLDKYGS